MNTTSNGQQRINGRYLILIALYSLFLIVFYQMAIIPLALDFSWIGFLLIALLAAIGYFAIPARIRKIWVILTILILLVSFGVNSINSESIPWRILDFPLMFVLLGGLSYAYGKIRWHQTLLIVVLIAICQSIIPLGTLPYYSHFSLNYRSPQLDNNGLFPFYPLVNHENEIYTLGHLPKTVAQAKADALAHANDSKLPPLTLANNRLKQLDNLDVIHIAPGQGFLTSGATISDMKSLPFTSFGLTGFPYYASSWTQKQSHVQQTFQLVDSPVQLLQSFLQPLDTTVAMDQRANISVSKSRQNWTQAFGTDASPQVPGSTLIAKGHFLSGQDKQLVLEGNNQLEIVDANQPDGTPIAVFNGSLQDPLTSDVVVGDIDGDGIDELMLNTSPARILKLTPDKQLKTIWISAKPSFRFEFMETKSGRASSTVIANDPSLVRDQPSRFLTAYTWSNGELVRDWRVFLTNMLFPFQISNGDWVIQIYGQHQFVELHPLAWSLPTVAFICYCLLVLFGLIQSQLERKGRAHV